MNGGEPFVEGESSSHEAQFSATVEAQVNPSYRETSCKFEYASKESVVAEGKGTSVPCTANLGSGGSGTGALASLTGLSSGSTYYYRVVAENTTNKKAVNGTVKSLKTLVLAPPKIESESSSPFSPFEATIKAVVNPESLETSCEGFEYASKESVVAEGSGTKVPCSQEKLGTGSVGVGVSATITGLEPGKKLYYYRVLARNTTGAVKGTIEKFETPVAVAPFVEVSFPEGVAPFYLVAGAIINPEFQETLCELEYATEPSILEAEAGEKVPCNPEKLGKGSGGVYAQGIATKLVPNTSYYYRFVAENETGEIGVGVIEGPFTTPSATPPIIESESTSEVTALHAKLEAVVNSDFQETSVVFEYSSEGAAFFKGTATKVHAATIAASLSGGGQSVSVDLGEVLQPNTTYYYRVVAENEIGKKEGEPAEGKIERFTTAAAPVPTTAAAQSVTENSATLSGTIDPEGAETKYHYVYIAQTLYKEAIEFGGVPREIDPAFSPYALGSSTPEVTIAAGSAAVVPAQSFTVTGLVSGTEYEYALVATSMQEENGQIVATTVIGPGSPFKVAGEVRFLWRMCTGNTNRNTRPVRWPPPPR